MFSGVQSVEIRYAIDARATQPRRRERKNCSGYSDQRIPAAPVVAIASEQANAPPVLLDDQSITVMLDLVDPFRTEWRLCHRRRQARLDKPRRCAHVRTISPTHGHDCKHRSLFAPQFSRATRPRRCSNVYRPKETRSRLRVATGLGTTRDKWCSAGTDDNPPWGSGVGSVCAC